MLINPSNTMPKDSIRRLTTPLSLLYMAAILREKGQEVEILDSNCEGYYNTTINGDYITYGLSTKDIMRRVSNYQPDLVGITSMFSAHQINALYHCKLVKKVNPKITVVLGGIHSSFFPEESLNNPYVDYVIMGEGEYRLVALIESLRKKVEPSFDGVAYKKGKEKVIKPMTTRIEDLDKIPLPARYLIDMEKYIKIGVPFAPFSRKSRVEQIMTTRGCNFNCNFCSSTKYWGRLRKRSIDNVMMEIDQLVKEYKIQEIQFADDNLTSDKERSKEIFRRMIPYNLSWCMPNGTMVQTLDKEMIELMASSGAYQLSFAIESGSQRVLKEIINKLVPKKEEVKNLIKICHDNNIQVHGMLMIGLPGETRKEIDETLSYPYETDLDSASYFIASPLPGSRLYQECKQKGYLIEQPKINFKTSEIHIPKDSSDYVMSQKEMEELVDKKTREFNEYAKIKNPGEWDKKFSQFLERHGKDSDIILGRVT